MNRKSPRSSSAFIPLPDVMIDANEIVAPEKELRPSLVILLSGCGAVGLISAITLPWSAAVASTMLGGLMIAGADVDSRTYLLPDIITWGAIVSGILAAPALDSFEPWLSTGTATARALATALALALLRFFYNEFRGHEGIGFGDIKLAAAVGAWLPLEAIPLCFALATSSGLVTVALARLYGAKIDATTKLPFGTFLCPALWLIFYIGKLSG